MNSPLTSKINWTQVGSLAFVALAVFGVNVPDGERASVIAGGVALANVLTIVFRTWFTAPR